MQDGNEVFACNAVLDAANCANSLVQAMSKAYGGVDAAGKRAAEVHVAKVACHRCLGHVRSHTVNERAERAGNDPGQQVAVQIKLLQVCQPAKGRRYRPGQLVVEEVQRLQRCNLPELCRDRARELVVCSPEADQVLQLPKLCGDLACQPAAAANHTVAVEIQVLELDQVAEGGGDCAA